MVNGVILCCLGLSRVGESLLHACVAFSRLEKVSCMRVWRFLVLEKVPCMRAWHFLGWRKSPACVFGVFSVGESSILVCLAVFSLLFTRFLCFLPGFRDF